MVKRDKDDYKLDYNHACLMANDLHAYFRFMLKDENIQPATYEMLDNTLDIIFEQYKHLYENFIEMD